MDRLLSLLGLALLAGSDEQEKPINRCHEGKAGGKFIASAVSNS
jgi:hypothetical protein